MIKFFGSFDFTGYGVAAKDMAYALQTNGVDLTLKETRDPINESFFNSKQKEVLFPLFNKKGNYQIVVVEYIPPLWKNFFEKGKYNIGYFFWETDRISKGWVDEMNNGLANEIWVPCQYNKDACLRSGVKKPIYIVPQCTTADDEKVTSQDEFILTGDPNYYKFYSIFQWTPRKNGEGLVQAFAEEFSADEKVSLVLKTYQSNTSAPEVNAVRSKIRIAKEKANNLNPPQIIFISEILSQKQMQYLHTICDCYVTANRGEGWSMPIVEAMEKKKPIITTQIGGITELFDENTAYIIPNDGMQSVEGMPWVTWYSPDQNWGKIDIKEIRKALRLAYQDRDNHQKKIDTYPKILDAISCQSVVNIIKERINQILGR